MRPGAGSVAASSWSAPSFPSRQVGELESIGTVSARAVASTEGYGVVIRALHEFQIIMDVKLPIVSRAMCLAYLVASPRLFESRARTIEQMRLMNPLWYFVRGSPSNSFRRASHHQVPLLIDRRLPPRMHQRARVVLLDDRRPGDDVATQQLRAIEHVRFPPATDLVEPHR